MRLRIQDFKCKECSYEFELMIDLDDEEDKPTCPECKGMGEAILGNPCHHKHVSHSQWRVGHGQ
jgi:putative FmdB family regulatory protein